MHRTDDDGHASNLFTDGDPSVPTRPTQLSAAVCNAWQEEIANVITNGGIVALIKGTNTQLRDTVMNLMTAQTATALKTFAARLIATAAASLGPTVATIKGTGSAGTAADGGVGVEGVGGSDGTATYAGGRGGKFTGGDGIDGGAAIEATGGEGAINSGVAVRAQGGAEPGGGYAKAIHATHGDVHVDDGTIIVDNVGSTIATETAHVVGAGGEPAFAGTWVNDDATFQGLRFWKDSLGSVHVQGQVKGGAAATICTLPAGYRPPVNVSFPGVYSKDGAPAACFFGVLTSGVVQLSADGGGTVKDQYVLSFTFRT